MKLGLFAIVAAIILAGTGTTRAADHPARAELLADAAAIEPGKPFTLGVRLVMRPHWHVYWLNPGDSGQAPDVEWALPEGFTVSKLSFPVPTKFQQAGGLVGYGYENEVLLLATVDPPSNLSAGTKVLIHAEVSWLVCEDICIPGGEKLSIELPVTDAAVASRSADLFADWNSRLPKPAEQRTDVRRTEVSPLVFGQTQTVTIEWSQAPQSIEWFPPPSNEIDFSDIDVTTEGSKTTVRFVATPLAGKKMPAQTMESVLAYTLDDQQKGLLIPLRVSSSGNAGADAAKP